MQIELNEDKVKLYEADDEWIGDKKICNLSEDQCDAMVSELDGKSFEYFIGQWSCSNNNVNLHFCDGAKEHLADPFALIRMNQHYYELHFEENDEGHSFISRIVKVG